MYVLQRRKNKLNFSEMSYFFGAQLPENNIAIRTKKLEKCRKLIFWEFKDKWKTQNAVKGEFVQKGSSVSIKIFIEYWDKIWIVQNFKLLCKKENRFVKV